MSQRGRLRKCRYLLEDEAREGVDGAVDIILLGDRYDEGEGFGGGVEHSAECERHTGGEVITDRDGEHGHWEAESGEPFELLQLGEPRFDGVLIYKRVGISVFLQPRYGPAMAPLWPRYGPAIAPLT